MGTGIYVPLCSATVAIYRRLAVSATIRTIIDPAGTREECGGEEMPPETRDTTACITVRQNRVKDRAACPLYSNVTGFIRVPLAPTQVSKWWSNWCSNAFLALLPFIRWERRHTNPPLPCVKLFHVRFISDAEQIALLLCVFYRAHNKEKHTVK
jgi:hypothetical protein